MNKEIVKAVEAKIPGQIEKTDIKPELKETGDTEIVLQRHGIYERSVDSPNSGSLTEEGAQDVYEMGKKFFETLFKNTPEIERGKIDILVVASDTQYRDEDGRGRRSMETAVEIIKALKEKLQEFGLEESQLLNTSGNYSGEGEVRPTPKLREPQMFSQSPEFFEFLKEKYQGMGPDFWAAFEGDIEKETREAMEAEGPDEIADRVKFMVDVFARYSRMYHKKHPDRRLVIWATTHYDTISPYVKREIFEIGKDIYLPVDYGGGISINLDKDGEGTVKIAGKEYDVPLRDRENPNK